ncbi:hypothetical protein D3C80_1096500 [compost metagenome]
MSMLTGLIEDRRPALRLNIDDAQLVTAQATHRRQPLGDSLRLVAIGDDQHFELAVFGVLEQRLDATPERIQVDPCGDQDRNTSLLLMPIGHTRNQAAGSPLNQSVDAYATQVRLDHARRLSLPCRLAHPVCVPPLALHQHLRDMLYHVQAMSLDHSP